MVIGNFGAGKTFTFAMQMVEEIYLEYRIRKYKEHPANTRKEYEVRKKIKKRYNELLNL